MAMIRKQYESSVRIDEVNKMLQDGLYNYLESEKLEILGQPLPLPSQVDFAAESFQVQFEIGVAPQFDLEISEKVKLPYIEIEPTKAVIDEEVENIRNRYGKMSEVDAVGAEDILFGSFQMVDKKGQPVDGAEAKEGRVGMKSISDKKVAKAALAMKVGDTLELNASKHFAEAFFDEAAQGGPGNLGFFFRTKEQIVSNIYSRLHMGNHIKRPRPCQEPAAFPLFPGNLTRTSEE